MFSAVARGAARHSPHGLRRSALLPAVRRCSSRSCSTISLDSQWTGSAASTSRGREAPDLSITDVQDDCGEGKHGVTKEAKVELMLRVSQLIEDDPQMAAKFAESFSTSAVEEFLQICEEGEKSEICPPTKAQLKQVCAASALPFLGFGILDNAVMIAFGDVLDLTFCTTFGFSTMAAAALGNTVSDGFGVFSGGLIEDAAARAGFEAPPLSRAQQALTATKRYERVGQLLGITVGCLIGMFPLLLINTKEGEVYKREKSLENMYEHLVVAVEDMLGADAAMIMLVDHDKQELYSRGAFIGGEEFQCRMKIGEGVIGKTAQTGHFINIADLRAPESRQYYTPEIHDNFMGTGTSVKSCLCMPIFGYDDVSKKCDKVVGVVHVINKQDGGHFLERDEDALAALCSHLSTSLSFVHGEEHGFDETLERCARALKTKGTRINAAANERVHNLYVSVLQEVARAQHAVKVELLTVDAKRGEVRLVADSDEQGDCRGGCPNPSMPMGDHYALSQAVASGKTSVALEVASDAGATVAKLCTPIRDGHGSIIAALQVEGAPERGDFGSEEVTFAEATGARLAPSLEGPGSSLARLLRDLQDL